MKLKNYRHGEIALLGVDKLPKGLKESKTNVLTAGSHGNSHTFNKGKLYLKNEDNGVFGYFVADGTSLLHPEHSPKVGDAKIADGIYKLIKQVEFLPDGFKTVID